MTAVRGGRFYITTAIDYVNASPHIGHAYEKIIADVLARFHRLRGEEVRFLTGTDEHGQKNFTSAAAAGKDVRQFVDENAARFRALADQLHLSIDDFIRTTEPRHHRGVAALWRRVAAHGDFYRKNYQALYCVGHEAFVTRSDLVDGRCPVHDAEPIVIEEENYFFRLSRYRGALRRLFEERPDFVVPSSRYGEMLNLIDTLEDISVSRPVEKLSWGIPVPDDPTHVIYVWFDALTNYISALGFGAGEPAEEEFRRWWPHSHHLIGKDINRFHSLLWPAMLLSAGLEPPRQILVHGFITVEGQKISKTLGNVIDPVAVARELADASGAAVDVCVDAIRYFLLREIPFGEDGDFSRTGLVHRFNADLANDYGNLLHRTLPQVERHFGGQVPAAGPSTAAEERLRQTATEVAEAVDRAVDRRDFKGALEEIWRLLGAANKYIDEEAPWQAVRADPRRAGTVLYHTLEAVRVATILLSAWMPVAAARVWDQLGIPAPLSSQRLDDARRWGGLPSGVRVRPAAPVFPRIEARVAVEARPPSPGPQGPTGAEAGAGGPEAATVTIDDFRRLDIRVGTVLSAARVPGTDKLIEVKVDIGREVRTLVTGLIPHYQPEDLVGRRIIVLANLQPRRVRGVTSQGMLLAAEWDGQVALLTVDRDAPTGARIS
ncbi:MAG: methionine--tRNA ligase [Armatimonadota bacterium]|nr:methionine--tRNA ligase [Armatimonadota bacterium]MDR7509563.1 methionine--tRNA ligase [Armatimonadota bacterium]MDR7516617.1 methionine--tRNA ligase [Armatimonadota bacterium]MDR7560872.1 methionine--tRNA ligase [Armatimonadota bacterium]MDR7582442.1 methionine--tRNA ligase [Armatimonadota bacterium]